jgi:hypothetical protein
MSYSDVRQAFEAVDPKGLSKEPEEQTFRWYLLMLMFEIYGALDSTSHSYREMLKLQQAKQPGPVKAPTAGAKKG